MTFTDLVALLSYAGLILPFVIFVLLMLAEPGSTQR